ncbi:MAG: carbon monoxide dehydrogenase subunit G [Rhodobacteraceae bacterium]|nr:carbon monoxide dehydrogenase subunit G [Paracoccaceae bacterium]
MQLSDHRVIKASPDTVWAAILNPEILKEAIPGCESMTGSPETGYEAIVVQKVGPVKARFTGAVTLSDIVPGKAVTISGEGKGGPAGFAKGGAKVSFTPEGNGTRLSYEVEANVGGKLAQLGSRIIDGFAKKLADQFFENFQKVVEGPAEPETPEPARSGEGEKKKSWLKRAFGG